MKHLIGTVSGILPQLLKEIPDKETLQALLEDENYVLQEKYDGRRCLVKRFKNSGALGVNKKGIYIELAEDIVNSLPCEGLFDGELIKERLFVFDLLAIDGIDITNEPYEQRYKRLQQLSFGKHITLVPLADSSAKKQALVQRLQANGSEGIVLKNKNALYSAGRSPDTAFKYKFYKTATCRVMDHTEGRRSVGLEMIEGRDLIRVGKVSIPPNKEIPPVGAYVEIRYLYAYKGGSLYQPVYLGVRDDQDATDIYITQLIYKES